MRRRYYIIFVAREKDGALRKIPIPMHYAGVFVAAAVVGAFTFAGLAGSYSRMLLKTASFNQVRSQQDALRKDYSQLQRVAHEKEMQAASLGSLASEVSALYGLRESRMAKPESEPAATVGADDPTAFTEQAYTESLDQLSLLRNTALSGSVRSPELGIRPAIVTDWTNVAGAPSLWPVMGRITSSFGERLDPFNGEGAFHTGVDISATFGEPVRAAGDGTVQKAGLETGYGRVIVISHGNGIETLYGHLSGFAVTGGQQVTRGQVIGYVGISGRSTGPHLHYEVRIHNTPVNPHVYLRMTMQQMASADAADEQGNGGN